MNKNAPDHIVRLQTACDRVAHPTGDLNALARQAPRDSEPTVHGRSITYGQLLEQLEAENRKLRAEAVELVLQIRALRDGIAALTAQPTGTVGDSPSTRADSCVTAEGQPAGKTQAQSVVVAWRNRGA